VDSFARTDTQKNTVHEQARNNRHRKRQKQYVKRSEKCMQQLKAQKQPGVSVRKKNKGGAGCRAVLVCSCINEEKCRGAEIRWAREWSFRRGNVRQKRKNRGKACRFHWKVQEVSLRER